MKTGERLTPVHTVSWEKLLSCESGYFKTCGTMANLLNLYQQLISISG